MIFEITIRRDSQSGRRVVFDRNAIKVVKLLTYQAVKEAAWEQWMDENYQDAMVYDAVAAEMRRRGETFHRDMVFIDRQHGLEEMVGWRKAKTIIEKAEAQGGRALFCVV